MVPMPTNGGERRPHSGITCKTVTSLCCSRKPSLTLPLNPKGSEYAAELETYFTHSGCSEIGLTSQTQALWFLFNPRINLSPFTKDFRGEEQQ